MKLDKKNSIIMVMICIIVILIFVFLYFNSKNEIKTYQKNLFYMDTIIQIKLYNISSNEANTAFEEIEQIYSEYHQLTDRFNSYSEINNIYYINNNSDNIKTIKLDERLYEMITYGLNWYEKSNGLLDINMGCIISKWKEHFNDADGIPSEQDLKSCVSNDIILGEDFTIVNNHPDIDLGAIAKGYTTQIVSEYLESIEITDYLINAGGNVVVGDHYSNGEYKIGIENPNDKSIYKILNVTNKAVVTSGGYERFYEYNGHKYSHIIDPNTKYPAEYMKSVTVICDDSAFADALTTTLFLMSIEEGQEFVKDMDMDIDVIWYSNDDEVYTTSGVENYEQE